MNTTLSLAHTELGIGKQEILEALYCIPLDASVAEVVKLYTVDHVATIALKCKL